MVYCFFDLLALARTHVRARFGGPERMASAAQHLVS